jgi:hypothetical protein
MIDSNLIGSVMGATLYDASGDKIGKVGQVYVDSDNGRPVWASVNTGLFGTSESFVPLHDADWDGEHLRVGYEKSFVTDAPRIDIDGALSTEDQLELYRYYDLDSGSTDRDGSSDRDGSYERDATFDRDASLDRDSRDAGYSGSAETRDRDDDLGTRSGERGRMRLRKYVVTEEQTITVPVTREEVRVEWEPTSDSDTGEDRRGRTDGPG